MANCIKCGRQLPLLTFGKHRNVCKWCVEYEAMQENGVEDDARQPVMPTPWSQSSATDSMLMTKIFAGICAAVFIGMALASEGKAIMDPSGYLLVGWGANYGPLTLSGDWWRLFTCMFVHGSIIHIALNMWCLWSLGALAESLYGHWTFAAVYILSGLAGSLVSVAHNPFVLSVGASGAVFGVAGALIASLKLGNFSLPQAHVKAVLSSVVSFAVYNLIFGAMWRGIDNAAHIGGLVAGLIMGALIAFAASEREHIVRRITVLTAVAMLIFGGGYWLNRAKGEQARRDRISLLIALKMYDKAAVDLEKKVAANPKDVLAHLQLAWVYEKQDRPADQESELKQALALPASDEVMTGTRIELGILYAKQKRDEDAKKLYTDALVANPKDFGAHLGLGFLLYTQKDYAGAVQQLEMVAQANPQTHGLYYNLGNSYAGLKKYDEAIAAYRKAQQIDNDDADIETALAEAYEAKGMTQQAEAARKAAQTMRNSDQD